MERYFATTVKGIEPVLASELAAIGASKIEPAPGGVAFEGTRETCYRANLWLRTALRVLKPIGDFECTTADDLYSSVRDVDWAEHMSVDGTLAVRANVRDNPNITHSKFAALKVKDAICDRFREETGRRPDVNVDDPDLPLDLHIAGPIATLSLDTSGESLHRRGYRLARTEAPLRETLAAAIIDFTEWDMKTPFVDLMCGSGTLPIEAAMKAAHMAPGLNRPFAFERSPDFDRKLWDELKAEARGKVRRKLDAPILGFDMDRRAVDTATENAQRAGVADMVELRVQALAQWKAPRPDGPGTIVVNPPYGERQGDEKSLVALYEQIGDIFKQQGQGYTGWVFTGSLPLTKKIGLRASKRISLWNGAIEARLLKFELYAASRKSKYLNKPADGGLPAGGGTPGGGSAAQPS